MTEHNLTDEDEEFLWAIQDLSEAKKNIIIGYLESKTKTPKFILDDKKVNHIIKNFNKNASKNYKKFKKKGN